MTKSGYNFLAWALLITLIISFTILGTIYPYSTHRLPLRMENVIEALLAVVALVIIPTLTFLGTFSTASRPFNRLLIRLLVTAIHTAALYAIFVYWLFVTCLGGTGECCC